MLKNILKGMVIGVANIIPGVSGGTMAVSMGIYDTLIHCVTHLFSEFQKSLKFLIPIFLGAGIALVGLSFVIEFLFENYPLPTNLLFIGLIVGGLPAIGKKVKGTKIQAGHIIAFLAFFALVVGMAALGETEGNAADLSLSLISIIKLFFIGMITSATMIVPGVSGSMILLLLGYYNPILATINDFIKALVAFDMAGILQGVGVLTPFGIGVVVGIFAIAKAIEVIFEKFPLYAYWAIIGLIVASPVAILLMSTFGTITVLSVLSSVIAFAGGFFIAMKLGE
ncbi:MAG: DUF368 domain-containing protein [Lachnospiraceae bacterium]|nr:DUF368 domain-containing protein [Lachnospiraceae bacterium]